MVIAALALVSPALALGAALLIAPLLARLSRVAALLCVAFALRAFLPEPPPLALPPVRAALAAPLLSAIPEPDASIAAGTLLGGRGSLPRDVLASFGRTGTSHLLAASGFNITLAAGAFAAALRPFGARAAIAGTVAAALGLALIAGLEPSIARAALMALVASGGSLLGRAASAVNALGAAVTGLLFVSPQAIADVGFLLSVTATAGLLLLARPLETRLRGPAWLRAQLASTCAATLASLPVAAEAFGRVSLVAPVANVAVAPLIAPLMTATAASIALGALAPPLALIPSWAAFAGARALRAVVESLGALPFAAVHVPHAGAAVVAVYIAGFMAARAPRPRPSGRVIAVAAAAMLAAAVALGAGALASGPQARFVALDVGQGDAFLIEVNGARALVDGGPDPIRTLRALGEALPPFVREIDVVALTHSHTDHGTGLAAVVERYAVGLAIEPVGLQENEVSAAWHGALAKSGVPVRAVRRGDRVRVGDLALEVVAPVGDPADPVQNLALRARAGPLVALLLGDATDRGQADLLLHPDELRADVFLPPHHGAASPLIEELLASARPRVALISVGAGNRYGHPAPQTLRALSGTPTLRTDRDGMLEVFSDGPGLRCRSRASVPFLSIRFLVPASPCA